jgi:hypothetical protein
MNQTLRTNNMKNIKIILPLLAFVLLFSGCKYEDGPALSLRTKRERAANTWLIDQVLENGVDKTADYKLFFTDYKMEMGKSLMYTLTYRPLNLSNFKEMGTWEFTDNKNAIRFKPTADQNSGDNWKILRLKEHEAWVLQTIDGKEVELRMKD